MILKILLSLLIGLLFPFAAVASDTGLVCAIDMGSNSFKLIVGEMKGGTYVQHQFTKTRLGVGDDMAKTGVISSPKLEEIRHTLGKYLAGCESKGIQNRAGVATAAVREAKNQAEVIEIARSLNLPLEVVLKSANRTSHIWSAHWEGVTLRSSITEVVRSNW